MVTTESMTDLPLPRIGQAIRAVLDDLYLLPVAYGRSDVVSKTRGWCHQGTHDKAIAWIDRQCAEAAVRAMREPSEAVVEAGAKAIWDDAFVSEYPAYDPEEISRSACRDSAVAAWPAMIDAMLSETQS